MRKNKAVGAKNKIKGGVNYNEAKIIGSLNPEKLYRKAYEGENQLPELIETYDRNINKTSKAIEQFKLEKERLENARGNNKREELELENLENQKLFEDRRHNLRVTNMMLGLAGNFYDNVKQGTAYGLNSVGSGLKFLGFAGNGVILRVILVILLLALIIGLGLASMYSPSFRDAKNNLNNKLGNLINPDYENYLKGPNPFGGLKNMFSGLNNMIPSDLRYKYTSLTNSLNYITTGKNQYEDYLIDRETITTGRSDNIIHMNFNNQEEFQKEKTFCSLTPKEIVLNFNSNLYQSSDYNKLDKNLREDLRYPIKYEIPITNDPNTGRFTFDIKQSYYYNPYDNSRLNDAKFNYLPKLFKKNNNEFIFNEYTMSSFNQYSGIIAIYGVKLLNKKHKDPIMIINDFNINNNAIQYKTALYYQDDKTFKYYDEQNVMQTFDFSKNGKAVYYEIYMLLDQSGNNRHFTWKENSKDVDFKWKPLLVIDEIGNYAIEFQQRMILFQNIPISSPKMLIKSTIQINNGRDNYYTNLISEKDALQIEYNELGSLKSFAESAITYIGKNKEGEEFIVNPYNKSYEQIISTFPTNFIVFKGSNNRFEIIPNTIPYGENIIIAVKRIVKKGNNIINRYNELNTLIQQKNMEISNAPKQNIRNYFDRVDGFMDFLSTSSTSAIKLQFTNGDKNKYIIQTDNQTKNDNYKDIQYSVNKKEIIEINFDDGKIETIGCIIDPRSDTDKLDDNLEIVGPAGRPKGIKLKNLVEYHNFIGYLYDLYIYDRTKMTN